MDLSQRILKKAIDLGFDRAAIVPSQRLPHGAQYREWLSEGRHGTMHYMDKYHDLRVDPGTLEEGTQSVVVVLKNYNRGDDLLPAGLRLARYAQGDDYHDYLRNQLLELSAYIHAESGADVATRPAVDTAPLLERDLAMAAGLGWIGKNAMLIHPEIGSFTFIAEVLVNLDLESTPVRVPDRCGTCSRCIDACPTGAIISPYLIDARRCISYLTIELRGPIPRELRPLIGDYLFGCDLCQAVCPWNRKAPLSQDAAFNTRQHYLELSPIELLQFDTERYTTTFRKSAIKRAKRRGLLRNAAVVVGNGGNRDHISILAQRLECEPEPLVRGHIAWAVGQMGGLEAQEVLDRALHTEAEAYVREEILFALEAISG